MPLSSNRFATYDSHSFGMSFIGVKSCTQKQPLNPQTKPGTRPTGFVLFNCQPKLNYFPIRLFFHQRCCCRREPGWRRLGAFPNHGPAVHSERTNRQLKVISPAPALERLTAPDKRAAPSENLDIPFVAYTIPPVLSQGVPAAGGLSPPSSAGLIEPE